MNLRLCFSVSSILELAAYKQACVIDCLFQIFMLAASIAVIVMHLSSGVCPSVRPSVPSWANCAAVALAAVQRFSMWLVSVLREIVQAQYTCYISYFIAVIL